ncbi:MAG: hypothetical protein ACR2P4_07115 [Gammaproteobacteria bacterium]
MTKPKPKRMAVLAALSLLLGACAAPSKVEDLLAGRRVDYGDTELQKSRALQYPPDLTAIEAAGGDVSLSEYRLDKVPLATDIAPSDVSARVIYRKSGNLRWLTVEDETGKVWVRVRAFLADAMGFPLAEESPGLGVMETQWLNLRAAPPGVGLSGLLDKVLGRVYDSGDRDKFRVRFEEADSGATDVYITHRHSIARFTQANRQGTAVFAGFEPQSSNPELEVEMLRRLMLHFAGLDDVDEAEGDAESESETEGESEAKTEIEESVDEEIASAEAKASGDYELTEGRLLIRKPLAEAWPLVFVGLDRGGFSVEDRDFIERAFYIRHSGEGDLFAGEEGGFFNNLFAADEPVVRDLKLTLAPPEGGRSQTAVTVAAIDDKGELTPEQSRAFLDLLLKNLP